ncbi:MAG: dienelactone hydrolase family protein [Armatimonadota bacterium]|nr:dienelactone hydrolase family protein [Armatimonadota bacterium]
MSGDTRLAREQEVEIQTDAGPTYGNLAVPEEPHGVVLFAHGSGSGRHSPRNNFVAEVLQEAGFATLLMDLLTEDEERVDIVTREHRFDIHLLGGRLVTATEWLRSETQVGDLDVGYFGSSTGAAAAMVGAVEADDIRAIVSRGGRVDLAGEAIGQLQTPILLIVGGNDVQVLELNRRTMEKLPAETELEVVAGAGHLFEEPGKLEEVANLAADFFSRHLGR